MILGELELGFKALQKREGGAGCYSGQAASMVAGMVASMVAHWHWSREQLILSWVSRGRGPSFSISTFDMAFEINLFNDGGRPRSLRVLNSL